MADGTFLTAEWIDLIMLNYEVDPAVLQGLAPRGVELDQWNGRSFVSVVGFQFRRTRLRGLPVPFHRDFEEVNLRFYVKRETPDGVRRGVVFVKEIVPRFAIAAVAKWLYNENYVSTTMRHRVEVDGDKRRIVYEWKLQGRWNRLSASTQGEAYLPPEDSEEAFITEHYWGYVSQRDGSTVEYRVEHPRWRVFRAGDAKLECDIERLYGSRFTQFLHRAPVSAFIAEGSEVRVMRGRRLERV